MIRRAKVSTLASELARNMLESLKPFYNAVLKPAVQLFVFLRIAPNHLTIFGTLLFVVAGFLVAGTHWHWALLLVIAGSLMDGWDGLLARETNQQSVFGAVLDSSCDRITEIALFFGLVVFYFDKLSAGRAGVGLAVLAMAGSIMVSYVKARCEAEGLVCKQGILQRPERLILLSFGLLLGPGAMVWLLGLTAALAWYTTIERLAIAAKPLKK
jgi:CDP-diacylglycerol---glycerol-3-phosphate 3-phosphatidyltransferase